MYKGKNNEIIKHIFTEVGTEDEEVMSRVRIDL